MSATSENRPKAKPRGKPFPTGPDNPGKKFPDGQSGNPGGRPKTEQAFRERCRVLADELLDHMATRVKAGKISAPQVAMVEAILDRAGYIVPKTLHLGGEPGGEPVRFEGDNPVSTILRELINRQAGDTPPPPPPPAVEPQPGPVAELVPADSAEVAENGKPDV